MKKLLFLLSLVGLFTLTSINGVQAQTVVYERIDVYNTGGYNFSDFILSYDTYSSCNNNIKVTNNTAYIRTFNFTVRLNGYTKYTGYVCIQPYSSVYFNNAFYDCNSSTRRITVNTW